MLGESKVKEGVSMKLQDVARVLMEGTTMYIVDERDEFLAMVEVGDSNRDKITSTTEVIQIEPLNSDSISVMVAGD